TRHWTSNPLCLRVVARRDRTYVSAYVCSVPVSYHSRALPATERARQYPPGWPRRRLPPGENRQRAIEGYALEGESTSRPTRGRAMSSGLCACGRVTRIADEG